jgi:hypothetical protein
MTAGDADDLTSADRDRLAAYRAAGDLAALVPLTGADDEHDAYFAAKSEWRRLRERELAGEPSRGAFPGVTVVVDGTPFHVHGVTHAGTDAERSFLREHAGRALDDDATVYCEQGIRPLYFEDLGGVCAMDDYSWARRECAARGSDSFAGVREDAASLAARTRELAFELVEAGGDVYGERVERALGDAAASLLVPHEGRATVDDYESFALARAAAEDPSKLGALGRHYATTMLPQPLERAWLRRHDPELELVTHARNERMVDYALAHHGSAPAVHLVVGAAHRPGVRYYLERVRDGERDPMPVEFVA